MTTTTAPPIVQVAAPARLEAAKTAAFSYGATLQDTLHLLELLSTATLDTLAVPRDDGDGDVQRAVALAHVQAALDCLTHTLRRFSPDVRCAPVEALNDVVAETLRDCPGVGCPQSVAPWDGSTCGDARCAAEFARAVGEA